jgi:CMP-N-acetylneuraminic acid synthetase
MSILAFIPARGGSKGLKNKNLYPINNKPLLFYTIKAAKESKFIDKIVVSSENKEIINFTKKNLVEAIKRPKNLSHSSSRTHQAVLHCLKILLKKDKYIPKIVIILQPTSPLRTAVHIDEALNIFLNNKEADSLVSCLKVPHNFYPLSLMRINKKNYLENYSKKKIPLRRQDKELLYARNGAAIYISRYPSIKKNIIGKKFIFVYFYF